MAGVAGNTVRGQVKSITYLGPARRIEVGVAGMADLVVREPAHLGSALQPGAAVEVIWRATDGWLIPGDEPATDGVPSHQEGLLTSWLVAGADRGTERNGGNV